MMGVKGGGWRACLGSWVFLIDYCGSVYPSYGLG